MTKSKIWTKKKVYNVFIFLIPPYANHSKIRSELHAGKSTKVWQSVIVSHSLNPCSMRRVYITVVNIFESCCDHRTPGKLACQVFSYPASGTIWITSFISLWIDPSATKHRCKPLMDIPRKQLAKRLTSGIFHDTFWIGFWWTGDIQMENL